MPSFDIDPERFAAFSVTGGSLGRPRVALFSEDPVAGPTAQGLAGRNLNVDLYTVDPWDGEQWLAELALHVLGCEPPIAAVVIQLGADQADVLDGAFAGHIPEVRLKWDLSPDQSETPAPGQIAISASVLTGVVASAIETAIADFNSPKR